MRSVRLSVEYEGGPVERRSICEPDRVGGETPESDPIDDDRHEQQDDLGWKRR